MMCATTWSKAAAQVSVPRPLGRATSEAGNHHPGSTRSPKRNEGWEKTTADL